MIVSVGAIILLGMILGASGQALPPSDPGLYLDRGGNFAKLDDVPFVGSSSGVVKFAGATSLIQIESARPRFLYRPLPNQDVGTRDIVLVRLDRKFNHREAKIGKLNVLTGRAHGRWDPAKLCNAHCDEAERRTPGNRSR